MGEDREKLGSVGRDSGSGPEDPGSDPGPPSVRSSDALEESLDLEGDVREIIRTIFRHIPFVRELGLEIVELGAQEVVVGFDMRPELVGHPVHRSLHGGVISAVLDTAGGLACLAQPLLSHPDLARDSAPERFGRLGTIDMRIDYLEPGSGDRFEARARVVRRGGHVAVTRMELTDDRGDAVALGMATYAVS